MPGLEGHHLQTPFDRVTLVAPILEDASVTVTPVIKGVVAKVDSTSVAVVTSASPLKVVDVIVTPVVEGVVIEEVQQELLDLGDPVALEEVRAELLEVGSGDKGIEVSEERINLHVSQS